MGSARASRVCAVDQEERVGCGGIRRSLLADPCAARRRVADTGTTPLSEERLRSARRSPVKRGAVGENRTMSSVAVRRCAGGRCGPAVQTCRSS